MFSAIRFLMPLLLAHALPLPLAFASEPLTQVDRIRSLPREEAARALPVKLAGVVIHLAPTSLVLHDGKEAVFLDFGFSHEQGVWKGSLPNLEEIKLGDALAVDGVTDAGGFSPMVLVSAFTVTGTQPIPAPIKPRIEELLSSSLDTQWVEVEGVVRKFETSPDSLQCLTIQVAGHSCRVQAINPLRIYSRNLVDAKVRVRGVLLNIANLRSQSSGLKIHCNGPEDIDILSPPPSDPFKAPRVSLDALVAFRPDAEIGHRCVSTGVVVFAVPGRFFYVMNGESSVRVDSDQALVDAGDLVEFSGFIDTTRILASFSEAIVRKTGTGRVPKPMQPTVSEILNPDVRSPSEMVLKPGRMDFDGRLIRITGVLRGILPLDKEGNTTLVVESGGHLVRAFIPGAASPWIEGSIVELTGVCELEMERIESQPWLTLAGFHLWLSSPEGLRVISEPPWWTPRRLGVLLAALAIVLAIALAWGYAMRHQVSVRGNQLAAEIAARESSKLEFDTILRERRRLANDLHDTLEQNLTGLALQLDIASRTTTCDPGLSQRHLNLARQFLERSRTEAHRTVWDLRADGRDEKGFLEILDGRVSSMVAGTGIAINLTREGDTIPMPDLVVGNLLLLAQEAVTNALKHSGASEIAIHLRQTPGQAELTIGDNGSGFDSAKVPGQDEGHFGLQGMRERAKRLGGKIDLASSTADGTSIRVTVPL